MKYLKIFHLITSLKLGGAESVLVNYLTYAKPDSRYEHHVAYIHDGPNRNKIEHLGIPTYHVHGLVYAYDLVIIWKLYRLVQKIKPGVIHTSLWSSNILGRLVGKMCGIPVISDLHGLPSHEGSLRNWFERVTMHWSDRIIAVADVVKTDYEKIIIGARQFDTSKLIVIKNGIDYENIRRKAREYQLNRADYGLADDDFVVGAVGRLEPIKSYDVLIKAFAQALTISSKKMKLCLVGDGSQMQQLQALVHALGVFDRVIFLGYKSEAYSFYPLFNCFALSSQSEGLSIALLEAMAFGLPVITTYEGMIHDVITHGINGFLVQPNDVVLYARALSELCNDQTLCSLMSVANIRLVKEHFSMNSVVKHYYGLYDEVCVSCTPLKSL